MLKSSSDFKFSQFWQNIYQRSMFFFNHFINQCIISRNQLNSYSVPIQQLFCYNFIFEILVHYGRLETFKVTYNVFFTRTSQQFSLLNWARHESSFIQSSHFLLRRMSSSISTETDEYSQYLFSETNSKFKWNEASFFLDWEHATDMIYS